MVYYMQLTITKQRNLLWFRRDYQKYSETSRSSDTPFHNQAWRSDSFKMSTQETEGRKTSLDLRQCISRL